MYSSMKNMFLYIIGVQCISCVDELQANLHCIKGDLLPYKQETCVVGPCSMFHLCTLA